MEALIDSIGTDWTMALAGLLVGLIFGAAAFLSKFCLRAATVEVAQGTPGPKLAIWLVAFLAALVAVQAGVASGLIDVSGSRQLAATGSMSGAIIGGLMFGVGMILARGCASRLLVLSGTGNLRALIAGLVLTLTAQASLSGVLSPAREAIASIWTVSGGEARSLLTYLPLSASVILGLAALALAASFAFGKMRGQSSATLIFAALVGFAVAGGWAVTSLIAQTSFDVVAVQSVTFTGPSTDTLMVLVNTRDLVPSFGMGVVIGVFGGAMSAALLRGEMKIQRFGPDTRMERYLVGGVLMGFGSMLAGGCAVGAGMSGGAILAITAWVAAAAMWIGAMATERVMALSAAWTAPA